MTLHTSSLVCCNWLMMNTYTVPMLMLGGVLCPQENSDAEQEDYEEKLKELEDVANPVVSKAYAASGGAGGEGGAEEDLGDHDEL